MTLTESVMTSGLKSLYSERLGSLPYLQCKTMVEGGYRFQAARCYFNAARRHISDS